MYTRVREDWLILKGTSAQKISSREEETFAAHMQRHRTDARISMGELAAKVGLSIEQLADVERGIIIPSADLVGKIESALNMKK